MQEANEDNTAWRRALRRDMVARRAALSEAEHDVLSARIVAHLIAALPVPQVVAFCWPMKFRPTPAAFGTAPPTPNWTKTASVKIWAMCWALTRRFGNACKSSWAYSHVLPKTAVFSSRPLEPVKFALALNARLQVGAGQL